MNEQDNNKVPFAVIEVNEAKRMLEVMAQRGVELEIRHNDATCRTGCKAVVEVWVKTEDLPALIEYIRDKNVQVVEAEGVEFDKDIVNSVYDPESKTAVCPACGTEFSTSEKECPECGLVFRHEG